VIIALIFVVMSVFLGLRIVRMLSFRVNYLEYYAMGVTSGLTLSSIAVYGIGLLTKNLFTAVVIALCIMCLLLVFEFALSRKKHVEKVLSIPRQDGIVFVVLSLIVIIFFARGQTQTPARDTLCTAQ
jgi:hypothetical protein